MKDFIYRLAAITLKQQFTNSRELEGEYAHGSLDVASSLHERVYGTFPLDEIWLKKIGRTRGSRRVLSALR